MSKKASDSRPRDASMSLLNNLFAHPLEPGYEQAARRRQAAGGAGSGKRPRLSLALMMGMLALGLLLTVAVLQAQGSAGVVSAEREGLVERIESERDQTERLQETVASLQTEITELEDDELKNTSTGQQLREELRRLQSLAGTMAVSGPGLSVVLDDAEDPSAEEDPGLARVLDLDLQLVVNGLWEAGAEAISINDQRITALSSIRMANDVILVNQQPLSPPYVVRAIGDSRILPSRFSEGSGGANLRVAATNGVRYEVSTEESLRLPAISPNLRYATNAREVS